jgi:RNA methyltransferase, TrmH family
MLSKNKIKWIHSLEEKKHRDTEKLFVVEGLKMVDELLNSPFKIHSLYATQAWFDKNYDSKTKFPLDSETVTETELSKISFLKTPQDALAIVRMPQIVMDLNILKNKLILALDKIQDPGNLGTIIRLADWFGIDTILCSPDTADLYNPKVVQSTMGSIFRVNVFYTMLDTTLMKFKNDKMPLYGTTLDGENIYNMKLSDSGIIILGNESKGIQTNILQLLDKKLFIPNFQKGEHKAESLNVGIAAAIVCSEFRKRLSIQPTGD